MTVWHILARYTRIREESGMTSKLRYACVGAGMIARFKHLPHYLKIDEIDGVAISDSDIQAARKTAEEFCIPNVYQDYRDMLNEMHPDLISVCTPTYTHLPISVYALERGIHVHCEKPIGLNEAEARIMADAKNRYGKKLMIAYNQRFTNEAYFIKNYIDSGQLGEVYSIRCGWKRKRSIPAKGGWFTDKELSGGGTLIDMGIHLLDLVMYFLNFPKPCTATAMAYSKFMDNQSLNSTVHGISGSGPKNVEDLCVGFIRLDHDISIDFDFCWAANIVDNDYLYYDIAGTKSGISCTDNYMEKGGMPNRKIKIYSEIHDTCSVILPDTHYTKPVPNEFEHFIDCIKNNKEPTASAEQGVEIMRIIDAVYRSAELHSEVKL
jgi:predicted dehydrogenase